MRHAEVFPVSPPGFNGQILRMALLPTSSQLGAHVGDAGTGCLRGRVDEPGFDQLA